MIDSSESGYGVELSLVLDAIDHQVLVPSNELKEFFWDMFIADDNGTVKITNSGRLKFTNFGEIKSIRFGENNIDIIS